MFSSSSTSAFSCNKPSTLSTTKPNTLFLSSSSRGFSATARASTSPSSSSSQSLLDVLDTEISYERDHAPEGPPALPEGWAFDSSSKSKNDDGSKATGSARLTLVSQRAPAGEKVTIDLLVDDQDDDDDEEEEDDFFGDEDEGDEGGERGRGGSSGGGGGGDASVVFTVTVSKDSSPSPSLVFDCRSDGTYLQVIHVSLEDKEDDFEEDVASYSGPMFDELDERLQAEFEAYLEQRGVVPSLGGALAALAEDKEAREYAAWLERVRAFVAA